MMAARFMAGDPYRAPASSSSAAGALTGGFRSPKGSAGEGTGGHRRHFASLVHMAALVFRLAVRPGPPPLSFAMDRCCPAVIAPIILGNAVLDDINKGFIRSFPVLAQGHGRLLRRKRSNVVHARFHVAGVVNSNRIPAGAVVRS